jgi:hypothetical protein
MAFPGVVRDEPIDEVFDGGGYAGWFLGGLPRSSVDLNVITCVFPRCPNKMPKKPRFGGQKKTRRSGGKGGIVGCLNRSANRY